MPVSRRSLRDQVRETLVQRIGSGQLVPGDRVVEARLSNVGRLRIDSAFDAKKQPALQLVPLPVASDGSLPYVGPVATGREKVDPEFANLAAAFSALVVDGIERQVIAMLWPVLESGRKQPRRCERDVETEPGSN